MNSQHPLWHNLFRPEGNRISEIADMWLSTTIFEKISTRECRELVKTMHPRYYAKDEVVFSSGDISASVILIRSGEIEISAPDKLLAELSAGDFFGEVALIVDEPRTADAIATKESELIFFLRSDLEEWVKRSPRSGAQFMLNIATVLAARLRHTNILLSLQND